MLQVREEDSQCEPGKKIRVPKLRQQNLLQTEDKSKKNQGCLIFLDAEYCKMKNEEKFRELQLLEQSLQNILMQKQTFQMELSETQSALKEIESSGDEVFKIVGQLMIKTDKKKVKDELSNKEKILELRLKKMEQQEESFMKKLEKLREEVIDSKSD